MDYDEARNALYIHAISCPDPDAVVAPIRSWEDYALVIFDEEKQPDDPAPTPVIHEGAGEFDGRIDETGEDVGYLYADETPATEADEPASTPEDEESEPEGAERPEERRASGGENDGE